ncbi:MAG: squalene/phytoene synthase family protein [Planctomycetes bacterium]|nr:squalene/phytoene synthase family protein [Planctomycetota bacterium]
MLGPVTTRSLDPILRGVSRSIFLTLRIAPRATRRQLGLAYLFCRAADTISDRRLLSRERRLEHLRAFRARFEGGVPSPEAIEEIARTVGEPQAIPEERSLLRRLGDCFEELARLASGDQGLVRRLVTTLTRGMEMDLERFPSEESGLAGALATEEELDRYTYHVAGCVGEFWTDLQAAHIPALASWDLPAMRAKGVRFGKGLQLTNILRDVDRDLAIGRAYFPRPRLEAAGVTPEGLKAGRGRERLRPILRDYVELTLGHYRAGWEYTLAIPRRVPRLRLACAWPLLIGLRTLALLARSPDPYAPGTHHKVPRGEVRAILAGSAARVFSDRALERLYRELERGVGRDGRA